MDDTTLLFLLIGAAILGLLAAILILRAQRLASVRRDRPFAASTEGETRCPACGMGNLWTDENCVACGARLA